MRRRDYLSVFVMLLWLCSPSAGAEFESDPETACAFLSDVGLNGRNYRRIGEGVYRCISRRRNLPFGGTVLHSMRFQGQGDPNTVRQLRLTLYVNSANQVQPALRRLLERGQLLVQRALEVNMPEGVVRSLLDNATGTWKVAGADVILGRSQIRSASHEYHLLIR